MSLAVTRVPPPVKPLAVALMVTPTGAVQLDLTLLPEVEVVRLDLRVVREEVRYSGTGGGRTCMVTGAEGTHEERVYYRD